MKFAMTLKQLLLLMLLILGGLQFVPVDRTNPPVESTRVGPDGIMNVFRRACFDCHSNETVWPWYGQVAPFSWLVARDVNRGREKLNFSTWNRLDMRQQEKLQAEIWKRVKSGDMPPPFYNLGHPEALITTDDHPVLRRWCRVEAGG